MENQENILDLYYNKHLKQSDIATAIGVSKQYVSKIVKKDSRFSKEKQERKNGNAIKRKEYIVWLSVREIGELWFIKGSYQEHVDGGCEDRVESGSEG